jgi:hypothetical protein
VRKAVSSVEHAPFGSGMTVNVSDRSRQTE